MEQTTRLNYINQELTLSKTPWKGKIFNFCVITHETLVTALYHIKKTEKRNPRWRLNRNWEILHSINYNQDVHDLEWILGCDEEPLHQATLSTANICILKYETKHPHLAERQQPCIAYGLAYLCYRGIIINENFEEIAHHHIWQKFTKHCCEKFLWSTHTFHSVNWKVFQHQGKNWISTGELTCSNTFMNGYQLWKLNFRSTALHCQYAHCVTMLPKHTTTLSMHQHPLQANHNRMLSPNRTNKHQMATPHTTQI
jgi:hypothetical protein